MFPSPGRFPSPLFQASVQFWTLTWSQLVKETTTALYVHDQWPIPAPPNTVPAGNASLYHSEVLSAGGFPWSFSVAGMPAFALEDGRADAVNVKSADPLIVPPTWERITSPA